MNDWIASYRFSAPFSGTFLSVAAISSKRSLSFPSRPFAFSSAISAYLFAMITAASSAISMASKYTFLPSSVSFALFSLICSFKPFTPAFNAPRISGIRCPVTCSMKKIASLVLSPAMSYAAQSACANFVFSLYCFRSSIFSCVISPIGSMSPNTATGSQYPVNESTENAGLISA